MKLRHPRAMALLSIAYIVAVVVTFWMAGRQRANFDQSQLLRYSFTLKNTTSRHLTDVEFATYAPVKQTATQRCCKELTASAPLSIGRGRGR